MLTNLFIGAFLVIVCIWIAISVNVVSDRYDDDENYWSTHDQDDDLF